MKKSKLIWFIMGMSLLLGGCQSSVSHVRSVPQTAEAVAEEAEEAGDGAGSIILDEERPEVIESSTITASIIFGYNKTTRYNRFMRVLAELENNTENLFEGSFYGAMASTGSHDTAYKKDVRIGAGETVKVELAIPVDTGTNEVRYTLADQNQQTILNKAIPVEINYSSKEIFIGVLSDDISDISYLSDTGVKTFFLRPENFPEDPLGLDTFDIIVVHDFNQASLNEKQREALEVFGESGSLQYLYGELEMNTTMEKVLASIGEGKRKQLDMEANGENMEYSLFQGIDITNPSETPGIGPYILILLCYLILIGPPLYFLLKKYDKHNLMWGAVPLFSVVFTLIIFMLGSGTRKTEPYVGYYAIEEKNRDETRETVYFGITSPHNEAYDLIFEKRNKVVSMSARFDYNYSNFSYQFYANRNERTDVAFNTVVTEDEDKTNISIRDNAAFSKNYFRGTSKKKEETDLNSSISVTKDYEVLGNITNNTGYSLTKAVLCAGDIYVELGDVEAGETVDVSFLPQYTITTKNKLYEGDTAFLESISGGLPFGEDRESYISRVYYAYEFYLGQRMSIFEKEPGVLVGVVKSEEGKEDYPGVLDNIAWTKSGVHLIAAAADINYTRNGETLIPNLDAYIKQEGEPAYDVYRFSYSDTLKADIQFEPEDNIKALIYGEELNGEFDEKSLSGFYGRVKAYNWETEEYDIIFVSGTQKIMDNVKPYLSEENQIKVIYEMGKPEDESRGSVYPVLSAVKEAG